MSATTTIVINVLLGLGLVSALLLLLGYPASIGTGTIEGSCTGGTAIVRPAAPGRPGTSQITDPARCRRRAG